jgi:hypothetical protein
MQVRPAVPVRPPVNLSAARAPVAPGRVSAPAMSTAVSIHYLRSLPIRVRGLASGRYYDFSTSRPVQSVDRRDLPGLLRTGFFRQA